MSTLDQIMLALDTGDDLRAVPVDDEPARLDARDAPPLDFEREPNR